MKVSRPLFCILLYHFILMSTCFAHQNENCAGPPFNFYFQNTTIPFQDTGCVDVVVENFMDIFSFEFAFKFDDTKFNYISAESSQFSSLFSNLTQQMDGPIVTVAYFDIESLTLPDETIAFSLCFEAVGEIGDTSLVEISELLPYGNPSQLFTTTEAFQIPDFNLVPGILTIGEMPSPTEDFIAELYFEDAQGRLDTLILGDIKSGTHYDMFDLQEDPIGDFDVRFIKYTRASPNDPTYLHGDCDHEAGDISLADPALIQEIDFETKAFYGRGVNCQVPTFGGLTYEFFIPVNSAFPIRVSWANLPYQDSCRSRSLITELPFYSVDSLWCEERINHPRVSLRDTNSVILEEPNFLTFKRSDGTEVSVYYMHLASTSFNGEVVDNVKNFSNVELDVYPNPAHNKLYLDTPEQNWNYQIMNLQGQQMMQGLYQGQINTGTLPSGIYFLQLRQEGGLYKAIKFVKD